eukprot:15256704-Alexandrium_andersonii.AAC.1
MNVLEITRIARHYAEEGFASLPMFLRRGRSCQFFPWRAWPRRTLAVFATCPCDIGSTIGINKSRDWVARPSGEDPADRLLRSRGLQDFRQRSGKCGYTFVAVRELQMQVGVRGLAASARHALAQCLIALQPALVGPPVL